MKTLRRLNFYVLIDVMLIFGVFFWYAWGWGLWYSLGWKEDPGAEWFWIPLFIVCLVGKWQFAMGVTKIENKLNESVWVKPKNVSEVIEVKPGETYYGAEGVRVCNTVFELRKGSHSVIKKRGDLYHKSFIENLKRPNVRVLPPDESWNPIFEIGLKEW